MPAIQTNYTDRHSEGRLGAIADGRHVNARSLTFVGADADAKLPFGIAACFGDADGECKLDGTIFAGLVIAEQVQDAAIATNALGHRETVGLMSEGPMWVAPTVAVAAGDPVHFVATTGAISNTGGVAIADAIFETSAAAGDLARVYLK